MSGVDSAAPRWAYAVTTSAGAGVE